MHDDITVMTTSSCALVLLLLLLLLLLLFCFLLVCFFCPILVQREKKSSAFARPVIAIKMHNTSQWKLKRINARIQELIHENTNGASEEMLTDFSFSVLVLFTCVGKSEFKFTWCTPSPPASASLVFLCTPLSLSCTSTVFSPLRCSWRCRTLILSLFCKEKENICM